MVCPPEKSSRPNPMSLPNTRPVPIPPAAAFAAAALHRQRMEQFFAMNRPPLNLPFPNPALIGQNAATNVNNAQLPNSTIFPSLMQQQALFIRQYQQFFQQQQLNNFLQKLEELRNAKLKAPETVSVSLISW